MRSIQGHHCRTALQAYAPKRRRRCRNRVPFQTQPRAQRSRFFLMETRAAFGPDGVPSLRSKRQPEQRCANYLRRCRHATRLACAAPSLAVRTAAAHRPRRAPCTRRHRSRMALHPSAPKRRVCMSNCPHPRSNSLPAFALAYSWRTVRHPVHAARPACSPSGSPSSAAPTTPALALHGAPSCGLHHHHANRKQRHGSASPSVQHTRQRPPQPVPDPVCAKPVCWCSRQRRKPRSSAARRTSACGRRARVRSPTICAQSMPAHRCER